MANQSNRQPATSVADAQAKAATSSPPPSASPYLFSAIDSAGHIRTMSEIETEIVRLAMAYYKGNISEVARRLGIGRSTLYRNLMKQGAKQPGERSDKEPRKATG